MTRPCPGPLAPTPPRITPPPGACDTHIHVIGPYDKYPLNPKCSYTAPEASIEKIMAFLEIMKIDRAVIAHVTAHGMDMTVTLDALKVLGDRGRGVAMVATDIDDAELDRLHDGGIRAIRLTPLFGDEVTLDVLKQMCGRIARLGWHMVYAPPTEGAWLEAAPLLVIGSTREVATFLARHGLAGIPDTLSGRGTSRVWTANWRNEQPLLVVAADNIQAMQALLRPLPHYGSRSYLVFDGRRAIDKGIWPTTSSPLSRRFN